MKIAKKQLAIGAAAFVIGAAGLLILGAYTGVLWDNDGMTVGENTAVEQPTATGNSHSDAVTESPEPAQPDIADMPDMPDMINMEE